VTAAQKDRLMDLVLRLLPFIALIVGGSIAWGTQSRTIAGKLDTSRFKVDSTARSDAYNVDHALLLQINARTLLVCERALADQPATVRAQECDRVAP
jgi:hypothetical protein